MATQYIQEFATLADLNASAPKVPGAIPFAGVVTSGSQVFYPGKTAAGAQVNFELRTQNLSKTIRLNSQTDSDTTSGDLIGFQSKPRTGVAGSQNVYGCQISAQVSNGIALSGSGSVIGGHIDVYLRGTSAGTIAGDVRGLQIELTTDDAGTRDITGYVTGLRIRKAFSAGTVTGVQSAIRIEKPEVQTGSESYDVVLDLTSTVSNCWHDTDTGSGDTEAGYFAVMINGNKRYVLTYSDAPGA
jgi:hypothetical protein